MSSSENQNKTIKNSKSLYTVAVYGFLAMFVIMVLPFVPLNANGSLFENGFEIFNTSEDANLIATISMLVHSIILLVVGLVCLHKLKKHRAGVGYSFYKIFKATIILALLVYIGFLLSGDLDLLLESFGLQYWYVVLGLYLVGLVFVLFAYLTNKDLHANKGTSLYLILSLLAQWGIYFLLVTRNNLVDDGYLYEFVRDSEGYIIGCSQNLLIINGVKNVYYYVIFAMFFFAAISTMNFCMPVKRPFQYMKRRVHKKFKYEKLSIFLPILRLLTLGVMTAIFIINSAEEEILLCVLMVVLALADVISAKIHNTVFATRFPPEIIQPEYDLTNKISYNASLIKGEQKTTDVEELLGGNVVLWEEKRLVEQGEQHLFKGKSSIGDICTNLQSTLAVNGIKTQLNQVQLTFAAILSSKVIFIKSNAKEEMIKRFSETVSEFFNNDLFFEARKSGLPNFEEKKEESLSERLTNIKYGVVSGLLVSNYLHDVFGLVFVDNTNCMSFSSLDVALINAFVDNLQSAKVGQLRNLPSTENYNNGNVKLSENARLIVFINEEQMLNLEDKWIKYSSIVELDLEEGVQDESAEIYKNISSYGMIYETLEETEETCFLTEDYWRKLDKIEEYLEEKTDIRFDNRFIRQIENNVAAVMSCGVDKMNATDTILATKIIPLVATQKEKIIQSEEVFSIKLEDVFGIENIPATNKALNIYGLKK